MNHPTRRDLDAMDGPATAVPATDPCAARWCERPATLQLLCGQDGQRLADHYGAREGHGQPGRLIHGLSWMYEHVRLAYPSVTGWTAGGGGSDIDDPEAEKLSAVLALRSDIHDHLTETAMDLAGRIGRKGPTLSPCGPWGRVMRSAAWLLVNIESLRAGQGVLATARTVELNADAAASEAASNGEDEHAAREEAEAARHAVTQREAVATVLEEADDLAARAHAIAPWRPAPSRLDGIPCRCGAVGTVHDHGDVRKCWRCGKTYSDEEWNVLMKVLSHRFRDQEGATA